MSVECVPFVEPPPLGEWPERLEHRLVKAAVWAEVPKGKGEAIAAEWRAKGLWVLDVAPTVVVYTGWRHATIMQHMYTRRLASHVTQEMQGFLCSNGWFFNRYMAGKIAVGARQVRYVRVQLTSEHLWDEEGNPRPYDFKLD